VGRLVCVIAARGLREDLITYQQDLFALRVPAFPASLEQVVIIL
jgi:hypothetical protein